MAQKIYLKNGNAHPDLQSLSLGADDRALWVSRDFAYRITFDSAKGSPFKKDSFAVPRRGAKGSGKIVGTEDTYKYTISWGRGKRNDPDVEILP
jgi:hypothetical protein